MARLLQIFAALTLALTCAGGELVAIQCKVGSFAARTTTGDQSITFSGDSMTPTVVRLWVTAQTADGVADGLQFSYGVAISGATQSVRLRSEDAAAAANAVSGDSGTTYTLFLTAANSLSTVLRLHVTSFDANGFTVNVSITDGTAYIVNYRCSNEASVDLSTITLGTSTGSISKTGLAFQPKCLETFSVAAPPGQGDSVSGGLTFSLGFYDGTNQGCSGIGSVNAADPTVTNRTQVSDKVIRCPYNDAEYIGVAATSLNSGGYTLDRITVQASSTIIYVLALADSTAAYKVGVDTIPTSTTTKDITGLGHTPVGVALASAGAAASTSVQTQANLSVGGASGAGVEACSWLGDRDGGATTETHSAVTQTKFFQTRNTNAGTLVDEADLQSFASGQFTIDLTTASGIARQFVYCSVGAPATGTGNLMLLGCGA